MDTKDAQFFGLEAPDVETKEMNVSSGHKTIHSQYGHWKATTVKVFLQLD